MTCLFDATCQRIHVASDLHLNKDDPLTAQRWHRLLQEDDNADAWIMLGDYFDVWVGDDLLDADPSQLPSSDGEAVAFWQHCAQQLQALCQRKPVYWMVGNRDFLLGSRFAAFTGVQLLPDPWLLEGGPLRRLLSHGDAWCTDDTEYMAFRERVRSPEWQSDFLAQPLSARLEQARAMRAQSQAHQRQAPSWSDVSEPVVWAAAQQHGANEVIHGHTHEGRTHALNGIPRHVLGDWALGAAVPRLSVLELTAQSTRFLPLSA